MDCVQIYLKSIKCCNGELHTIWRYINHGHLILKNLKPIN